MSITKSGRWKVRKFLQTWQKKRMLRRGVLQRSASSKKAVKDEAKTGGKLAPIA
jgi:hypothetical protein